MEINEQDIIKAHDIARQTGADSTCKVLEALFPTIDFSPKDNRPVTERIKTLDDACIALGYDPKIIKEQLADCVFDSPDEVAYHQLRIIVHALNEGWEPQFTEDEKRWCPWFWLYTQDEIKEMEAEEMQNRRMTDTGEYQTSYSGFAFASSDNAPSYSAANVGSRLCLKTEAIATYCGKQFIELWMDLCLIRK